MLCGFAVLSTSTFWTFVREFSPIELREGRDEKDIWADWGRCSVRTVLGEARTHTGLHIVEAKRRFPCSDLKWRQEPCFVRSVWLQLTINSDGRHIEHVVVRFSLIRD